MAFPTDTKLPQPFPFLDLPAELQIHCLEHYYNEWPVVIEPIYLPKQWVPVHMKFHKPEDSLQLTSHYIRSTAITIKQRSSIKLGFLCESSTPNYAVSALAMLEGQPGWQSLQKRVTAIELPCSPEQIYSRQLFRIIRNILNRLPNVKTVHLIQSYAPQFRPVNNTASGISDAQTTQLRIFEHEELAIIRAGPDIFSTTLFEATELMSRLTFDDNAEVNSSLDHPTSTRRPNKLMRLREEYQRELSHYI